MTTGWAFPDLLSRPCPFIIKLTQLNFHITEIEWIFSVSGKTNETKQNKVFLQINHTGYLNVKLQKKPYYRWNEAYSIFFSLCKDYQWATPDCSSSPALCAGLSKQWNTVHSTYNKWLSSSEDNGNSEPLDHSQAPLNSNQIYHVQNFCSFQKKHANSLNSLKMPYGSYFLVVKVEKLWYIFKNSDFCDYS